jgi:hypothetical protein
MNSPLIYEVQVRLPEEIYPKYKKWLFEHVEEMLELPYFSKAEMFEANDLTSSTRYLKTHFYLSSPGALDEYFAKAAASMRGRLPEEFRDSVSYSRFALTSIEKT